MYLDPSAVVPLFKSEINSVQAAALVNYHGDTRISDFVIAEVSAAASAYFRTFSLSAADTTDRFRLVDALLAQSGAPIAIVSDDVFRATALVRRDDLRLRAPDAIHLAVCARIGAKLLTFDKRQSTAALILGIPLVL